MQSAAFELSRAYINHSNAVLGEENSNVDFTTITNALTASLKEAGLVGAPISGAGGEPGPGEKRKRKRTDPNAPKRTLTPFFLYMHHNRRHIAEELGSDAKPKEVSNEGTRRWAEMPESQKEVCSFASFLNLVVGDCDLHAYLGLEKALCRQPGDLQGEGGSVQGWSPLRS